MRWPLVAVLTLWGGAVAQGFCQRPAGTTLELAGLGVVSFGDLRYSAARDEAELFGGVCLHGSSWTLEAASLRAVNLSERPGITAQGAVLRLEGWTIRSERLAADEQGVRLEALQLMGAGVTGRAEKGAYTFSTGRLLLEGVEAGGEGYRIESLRATLLGETLAFDEVVATSCTCGEALSVSAPELRLDLGEGRLLVRDGVLHLGGLELALGTETELSKSPALPVEAKTFKGAGLTLQLTRLALGDGLSLSAGLAGLDKDHPLIPFALFHADVPGLEATVGRSAQGAQADVRVSRELGGPIAVFGIRNRHWAEEDFLHEGFLGLEGAGSWRNLLGVDSLRLTGSAVLAASQQTLLGEKVTSPRLATALGFSYALATDLGRFGLDGLASFSVYPAYGATQYGLRLNPSWSLQRGPFTGSLSFDRLATDGGSPFSTRLDRLVPKSLLEAGATLAGGLGGIEAKADAALRYTFLPEPGKNPLRTLRFSARADIPGRFTLSPQLELELAGLLSSQPDREVKAFAAAGVGFTSKHFELGLYARYNLVQRGLEVLEVSGMVPLSFDGVTLEPFLAVNLAGTFLSGYGLRLTYRSCCGTLAVGFRQHRGEVTTTFGLELPSGAQP